MTTKLYITKTSGLLVSAVLTISALFNFTVASYVLAAPYGCGTYGSDGYQANCPAPSTTPALSEEAENPTIEAPADDGTVIVLNVYEDFFSDTGITVTNLEVGDVIGFCIEANAPNGCSETNNDYHTATIKKIDLSDPDNPIITITFAPTPFDIDFKKGETKKVDLDKDGTEDVEVTFVDMVDGHPIVTMKKINPLGASTPVSKTTSAEDETSQNNTWIWIVGIGSVVCAVIATMFVMRHKNRTKNVTW